MKNTIKQLWGKKLRDLQFTLLAFVLSLPLFASPSDQELSLWQGMKPYGSEAAKAEQMRQSFYELARYFTTLDQWRTNLYDSDHKQQNWPLFRTEIQQYDFEDFAKLKRAYKTNFSDAAHILFEGHWTKDQEPPRYDFTTHQQTNKPMSADFGAVQGQFSLSQSELEQDNTLAQFKAQINLDTLRFSEFLRSTEAISHLLSYKQLKRFREPAISHTDHPNRKIPDNFSDLESLIHDQFYLALPSLMQTLESVTILEKLAEQQFTPNGMPITRIQHTRQINLADLKKHFPDTYQDYKTLLNSVSYRSEVVIEGNKRISTFSYDSKHQRVKVDLALADGAIALQTLQGELTDETITPSHLQALNYQVRSNLKIEMFGLDIKITDLTVNGRYSSERDVATSDQQHHIALQMNQAPKVDVEGALLYLLPSWLIDLLIPGTMETLIADTFNELMEGNQGEGVIALLDFKEQGGTQLASIELNAEMPHEFLQAVLKIEDKEQSDRPRLYNTLRQNLRQDFSVFSALFNDTELNAMVESYKTERLN